MRRLEVRCERAQPLRCRTTSSCGAGVVEVGRGGLVGRLSVLALIPQPSRGPRDERWWLSRWSVQGPGRRSDREAACSILAGSGAATPALLSAAAAGGLQR